MFILWLKQLPFQINLLVNSLLKGCRDTSLAPEQAKKTQFRKNVFTDFSFIKTVTGINSRKNGATFNPFLKSVTMKGREHHSKVGVLVFELLFSSVRFLTLVSIDQVYL